MRHAAEQSQRGETVVCLVPARTDVEWFQEWVFPYADELRFLRGRVNFVGGESGSTFPSVVVIYRGRRPGAAPRLTTMVQSWKRGRRRTR
jgi:site-specific DNA-methyltransferase (adenine-specific)